MTREETLVEYAKKMERLIEELDEAMASDERIEMDTEAVGGFVSTLHITEMEEDIINRAINVIEFAKEFANEPCIYDDQCPSFVGTRHGVCDNCKARRALAYR